MVKARRKRPPKKMSRAVLPCPLWPVLIVLAVMVKTTTEKLQFIQKPQDEEDKKPIITLPFSLTIQKFMGTHVQIDGEKLMKAYSTICPITDGCSSTHISGSSPAAKTYPRGCPSCICNSMCVGSSNCCPGIFYGYLSYKLTKDHLYGPEIAYRTKYHIPTISGCPESYRNQNTIDQCSGDVAMTLLQISPKYKLAYRNHHCAICNNDIDVQDYEIEVIIPSLEDLYETISEDMNNKTLAQIIKTYNVTLVYQFLPGYARIPSNEREKHQVATVSRCNETGFWQRFDADIAWGCKHLNLKYRTFKNVFCYICNPGVPAKSTVLVRSCNQTGAWKSYNRDVVDACLSQPNVQRLYPYKNIHCMVCNGADQGKLLSKKFSLWYHEIINATIITATFERHVAIEGITDFLHVLNQINAEPFEYQWISRDHNSGDAMEQIREHEAICGKWSPCRAGNISDLDHNPVCEFRYCSCDTACLQHYTCCPEVLLGLRPYACLDLQQIPKWHGKIGVSVMQQMEDRSYLSVDSCINKAQTNQTLIDRCLRPDDDLLFHIPVRKSIDIVYKNIFCLLCNTDENYMHMNIYMDIEMHCNNVIEFRLILDIDEFLYAAKEHCSMIFKPRDSVRTCRKEYQPTPVSMYDRQELLEDFEMKPGLKTKIETAYVMKGKSIFTECNQTKNWVTEDNNVKQICEGSDPNILMLPDLKINGNSYKNFACFICNPLVQHEPVDNVSTCNYTGLWPASVREDNIPLEGRWTTAMEGLCNTTRHHPRWSPFKNYFCSECNLPLLMKSDGPVEQKGMNPFRHLFTLSGSEWMAFSDGDVIPSCLQDGMHVNNKHCSPIICLEGRTLEADTCRPNRLLIGDMQYIISVALTPVREPANQSDINACFGTEFLPAIGETERNSRVIQMNFNKSIDEIVAYFGGNRSTRAELIVQPPLCNVTNDTFLVTVRSVILFRSDVFAERNDVSDVERSLIDSLKEFIKLNTESGCELALQPNQVEWKPRLLDDAHVCALSKSYFESNFIGIPVVVDRFLECPHVKFTPKQYQFINETGSVKVIEDMVTIPYGYYKTTGNEVQICVHDYRKFLSLTSSVLAASRRDAFSDSFELFGIVANYISVLFLALTFSIYCMYPSLRNLPGKNTMVLVTCLFCAQLLLGLALRLPSDTLLCQIMGALIHYFWLATFFAMNVSSFHILTVFWTQGLTRTTPDNERQLFYKYLMYVLVAPLVPVSIILFYHFISTNWQTSGYGQGICFLSNSISRLFAFIAPITLIFIFNITFFSMAFHKIRTAPKIQKANTKSRSDFLISIKLCVILGLTWPLQIVDSFFSLSVLSFVVEAVNALQGLLLFLFLVCNGRVLTLLKETFGLDKKQ